MAESRARFRVDEHHHVARAHVAEPVRLEPRDQVGRANRGSATPRCAASARSTRTARGSRSAAGRTRRGPPASAAPRAGSRTAPARPGRGAGSRRRGRAGRGPGWRGPAPRAGAGAAWWRHRGRARAPVDRNRVGHRRHHSRAAPERECATGQARSARNSEAPDGRSITAGSGSPPSANQARNCSRVASAVPWYSSSSWTPAMSSPCRVRNSSRSDGSGQSRTSSRPPGRRAAQAARRTAGASVELVERVLEVGQVVLAGLARLCGAGLADRDPVGQPGRLDLGPRPGDRVRLEFDADELEAPGSAGPSRSASGRRRSGRRRRGRRCDRSATSCGRLGERLLEEDRDVLRGQALDGDAVAVRPVADRLAGPEEVDHPAPVERGDGGVDELAAEVFRAARRRAGSTATSSSIDQPAVLERRRGRARRPPRPRPRPPAGWQPVAAASSAGRHARRAGGAQPREQARARCRGRPATSGGSRRGWRSGRRIDRRGPSSAGLSHGGRRAGCRPGTVAGPDERPMQRSGAAPGFWGSMDTDSPLIAALADDLDALVRGPRPGPPGPALLDRAAHARRPARRRGGRPGRPRPRLSRARRLRRGADPRAAARGRGWRRSCSTCAARGSAAAARAARPPLSLDAARCRASSSRGRRSARPGRASPTRAPPPPTGPTSC